MTEKDLLVSIRNQLVHCNQGGALNFFAISISYGDMRLVPRLFWAMSLLITRRAATRAGAMPPAIAAIAELVVLHIDGKLLLKMPKERGTPRSKVTLSTPTYSSSVWLSRHAPLDRLPEMLAAFDELTSSEITDDFRAALVAAGVLTLRVGCVPAGAPTTLIALCLLCAGDAAIGAQRDTGSSHEVSLSSYARARLKLLAPLCSSWLGMRPS